MTLKALILRVDGGLCDLEPIRRVTCNTVFEEAGFPWTFDADSYRMTFATDWDFRAFEAYALSKLRRLSSPSDAERLAGAMRRRYATMLLETLTGVAARARPGVRELICTALADGMPVALVSGLPQPATEKILASCLGAERSRICMVSTGATSGPTAGVASGVTAASGGAASSYDEAPLQARYEQAVAALGVSPAETMAIEATRDGTRAADALGLATLVMLDPQRSRDGFEAARAIVDDIKELGLQRLRSRSHWLDSELAKETLEALCNLHGQDGQTSTTDRSEVMIVQDILKTKGSAVKSVSSSDTVQRLSRRLADEKVGAMVVLSRDGALEGIVSERDVARGLAMYGCDLLTMPVGDVMTKVVITCSPRDSLYGVAKLMTKRRIRHVPVIERGALAGLVSIGDVLNHRLEELELEAKVLRDYAIALK
ncbi:MAG: CBS domain-containing protein [Hyphomicrobium sp.]